MIIHHERKNAVAEIKALKSENKGLWTALKKFFTSFFNKINKLYKETPPDAPEGGGSADLPDSGAVDRPVGGDTDIPADKDASDAPEAVDKTDKSKNPAAEALADSVTELMSGLPSLQVLAIVLLVTVAVLALGVIALVAVKFLRG